jgi:hypothetical protein
MANENVMNEINNDDKGVFGVDDLVEGEQTTTDLSIYVGKKVIIENVYRKFIPSKFGKDAEGKQITLPPGQEIMAPVLSVETEPVFTYKDKDGNDKPWRASEIFSLREKIVNGKKVYDWSPHEKGALRKFLAKMKVDHPSKLKGKTVQLITRGPEENQFLGFIKE